MQRQLQAAITAETFKAGLRRDGHAARVAGDNAAAENGQTEIVRREREMARAAAGLERNIDRGLRAGLTGNCTHGRVLEQLIAQPAA
jgi:hypothetical protein